MPRRTTGLISRGGDILSDSLFLSFLFNKIEAYPQPVALLILLIYAINEFLEIVGSLFFFLSHHVMPYLDLT